MIARRGRSGRIGPATTSTDHGPGRAEHRQLRLHRRRRRHRGLRARQPAVGRPAVIVLLLEAGGKDNYFWIHVPVGYLYTMNNPRTDWCFKTEPEPGLNGRALNYPRGRVLGGCSSINGMIYMRGQARDYDQWRQLGNRRLGLGRRAALSSSAREDHCARRRRPSRRRRRMARRGAAHLAGRSSTPSATPAAEVGIPQDRRLQPRRQRGLRLFPGQPAPRRALDRAPRRSCARRCSGPICAC